MSPGGRDPRGWCHWQRTVSRYQEDAERAGSALRRAEQSAAEKELQVEELQRLLAGMEKVPALRGDRESRAGLTEGLTSNRV